jgi:hypothetical protein
VRDKAATTAGAEADKSSSDLSGDDFAPIPPRTPTPEITFADWPTPMTMRSRKKGIEYVATRQTEVINGSTALTLSVKRVADKPNKAAETAILRGGLSTHRLHDLTMSEKLRQVKKDGSKIVQKFGEIYGKHALRQIEATNVDEMVNIRAKQERKKWMTKFRKFIIDGIKAKDQELRLQDQCYAHEI